jgi:N,N-dimethylformamidase
MRETIRGYTDRPSAQPGESISVHVSASDGDYTASLVRLVQLDRSAEAPPVRIEPVVEVAPRTVRGRRHRTQVGNYVEVAPAPPTALSGFTFFGFVQPTRPYAGRQVVASVWDDSRDAGWSLEIEEGRLSFRLGDGHGRTARVTSECEIFGGAWYAVGASWDAERQVMLVAQKSVVTTANSLFGPVVPLDSSGTTRADTGGVEPAAAQVPLVLGGVAESETRPTWVTACFNGKLDSPRLLTGAVDDASFEAMARGGQAPSGALIAHWDFAAGITTSGVTSDEARDVTENGHHGVFVNQPDRAMTGWNWTGRRDLFTSAPEEYGAIWLHADALDDCRWPVDFELDLPRDLPSGCYAVHLVQGDREDHVPFFVRPGAGRARAPIAVLMPTLSYVVYGNYHNVYPWEGWGFDAYEAVNGVLPLDQRDVEMMTYPDDYGRSPYDFHIDGRGVQHATWRRPILDARPGQPFSFNFQADFYLIDWLEHEGLEYDIITDHDLHREGADLLRPYNVVVTGSHPEYYTWEMLDGLEQYLTEGGRGMYLGGNGFYWVTALHPDKPWLAEVRRGDDGDTAWKPRSGEYHHAFTGERGGLWRHRGRAPQKIWGTGYSAHTLGTSGYYVRMPDSLDPRVAWIFDGIGPDEVIGEYGLVGGGAAGIELDSYDRALGTPPHALLLGSSVRHDQSAMVVPEEINNAHPATVSDEHPKIRADITYFTTAAGGGVFTTSAIGWSGALPVEGYVNAAARLTGNVLRRFASPDPLDPITEES